MIQKIIENIEDFGLDVKNMTFLDPDILLEINLAIEEYKRHRYDSDQKDLIW